MDREEKQLEAVVDSLTIRTQDLKNSIANLIYRLETEYESMTWAQVVDSFALYSAQINNLMKIVKNDKTPSLRNRVVLPLRLSPDLDEELAKLTDGRVGAFNHDMVPDYLRTKPDPDIEEKEKSITLKMANINHDQAQKQITMLNKIANNMIELVKNSREEWESESGRANQSMSSSQNDTNTLIAAITSGKGLKPQDIPSKGSSLAPPSGQQPGQSMPPSLPLSGPRAGGKAPATIKTNIKSANSMHPYR